MSKASSEYQIFAKPAGSICNLACRYCYYLEKEHLYPGESFRMPDDVLEEFIVQHINTFPGRVISFSWHGGEPTILGLDYFQKIVAIQRRHQPRKQRITNGIQTNGTLLDDNWCSFLAAEGFAVGISLDGPEEMHDRFRVTKSQAPTHQQAMRGYRLLKKYRIPHDILCVVHSHNVQHPLQVYRFFKQIGAQYLGFLPLVEPDPDTDGNVSPYTVKAEALGDFLCTIFDEWISHDIGRINVQIFDEAARTAFGQEPALCIFRKTCGDVPVIERNGDFFACDHFVDVDHHRGNIRKTPLVELLESPAQIAFGQAKSNTLPRYCRSCGVRDMCNGGCPKDRFCASPDGDPGLNYLCPAYKRFFTHCRPFISELAALWRSQSEEQLSHVPRTMPVKGIRKPGRNDPCPCGSGKKYKKCCMGK